VLSALAAAGRRVPDDVALVGCDDVPLAAYLVPALTTVHVPLAEAGEQAVGLLLRRIRGEPGADERIRLPVSLAIRASCGAPAAAAKTIPAPAGSQPGATFENAGLEDA
jgi:DNA-binding LacI/PurR family transcriptional regulator